MKRLHFGRLEIAYPMAEPCALERKPCRVTGTKFDLLVARCEERPVCRACCRASFLLDLLKGEDLESSPSIDVQFARIRAIEDNPKRRADAASTVPIGLLRIRQGAGLMLRLYFRFYIGCWPSSPSSVWPPPRYGISPAVPCRPSSLWAGGSKCPPRSSVAALRQPDALRHWPRGSMGM